MWFDWENVRLPVREKHVCSVVGAGETGSRAQAQIKINIGVKVSSVWSPVVSPQHRMFFKMSTWCWGFSRQLW